MTLSQRRISAPFASILVGALVLTGCASSGIPSYGAYHPSKPPVIQDADNQECLAFARSRTGDPADAAVRGGAVGCLLGAGGGAAAGAIGGAIAGNPGMGAGYGAAAGALLGIFMGAASEHSKMKDAHDRNYIACMQAKGYVVR